MSGVWLLVFLFNIVVDSNDGSMSITTSTSYFIPNHDLKVNCSSTEALNSNIISFSINFETIVKTKYFESSNECKINYVHDNSVHLCGPLHGCECALNGRSALATLLAFNVSGDDSTLTFSCSAISANGFHLYANAVLRKIVYVKNVTITDARRNTVTVGEQHNFTCATNPSLPSSRIQWYLDGKNVTDQAVSLIHSEDSMSITTSRLIYTGREIDHHKSLVCRATNSEDGEQLVSIEVTLSISVPISNVYITQNDNNIVVKIQVGGRQTFTCTTDAGRPSALIQWYIGKKNVTSNAVILSQPDGTKFITSSTLVYIGEDSDHNKDVFCEAYNIDSTSKLNSDSIKLYIAGDSLTQLLQPESALSYGGGLGIGAAAVIAVEVVVIGAVFICIKVRRNMQKKDPTKMYDRPKKHQDERNVYNELTEMPKEIKTDQSNTYEECGISSIVKTTTHESNTNPGFQSEETYVNQ